MILMIYQADFKIHYSYIHKHLLSGEAWNYLYHEHANSYGLWKLKTEMNKCLLTTFFTPTISDAWIWKV